MNFPSPKLVASKWFCFENPYALCFESLKTVAMNGCCNLNISRSLSLDHLWFVMVDFHIIASSVVKLCRYNIHIDQLWGKWWSLM
jgi:hypothetical protein